MRKSVKYLLVLLLMIGCSDSYKLQKYGQHYQLHNDHKSLLKVVNNLQIGADSSYVRSILGTPIDFGFDFRFLLDSVGENGCAVGGVFHFDDKGKVDQKWIGEICE